MTTTRRATAADLGFMREVVPAGDDSEGFPLDGDQPPYRLPIVGELLCVSEHLSEREPELALFVLASEALDLGDEDHAVPFPRQIVRWLRK